MNSLLMLGVVLLATFALGNLVLSGLVAIGWRVGLRRSRMSSPDLLAVRLLPAGGAVLLAVVVVLPAFLDYEPPRDHESAGPWLLALAALALVFVCHGCWRGWRAWAASRSQLHLYGPAKRWMIESGHRIRVVDARAPVMATVGGFRPELVASESVINVCSQEEFRQVVAHEAAHISAGDNFKLLLLLVCPDVIAWTKLGTTLFDRWRIEAEFAADQRAVGDDPRLRIALASALIKVARLFPTTQTNRNSLIMLAAEDDIEGRVRQLLGPARTLSCVFRNALVFFAVMIPVAALPLHSVVHELIETLVSLGL